MKNKLLILIFTLSIFVSLNASEIRGIWATSWEIDTKEKIDNLVNDACENNFNVILPEIRYRGDALYKPNKNNSDFYNSEEKSYILKTDFDPLNYLIKKAKLKNIKIFAWATIFVVTPHSTERISKNHLYHKKKEWITYNDQGKMMSTKSCSGAFVDPGIPAVQDYTLSVLKDIANNYNIDGFQLDYIRYPGSQYGYNPNALKEYDSEVLDYSFQEWKQKQITRFVKRCYVELKGLNPNLIVSAAVFPDIDKARRLYAQNWSEWIEEGYIDFLFFMAYNSNSDILENQISKIKEDSRKKIIIGLRAWADFDYPVQKIIEKIDLVRENKFPGFSLFHYGGLVSKRYFSPLKLISVPDKCGFKLPKISSNYIFGHSDKKSKGIKVKIADNEHKHTFIDNNGFYLLKSDLAKEEFSLVLSKGINDIITEKIPIDTNFTRYNLSLIEKKVSNDKIIDFSAEKFKDKIRLNWSKNAKTPIKILKKNLNTDEDYSLCKVIFNSENHWYDKFILSNYDYRYKITTSDSLESNELTIKN